GTVDDGDVEPAVLVEVAHQGAKAGATPFRVQQPGPRGLVEEVAAHGPLHPQRVTLHGQVGDEKVKEPVAVDVADGHAHASLGLTHGIDGNAVGECLLYKGAV